MSEVKYTAALAKGHGLIEESLALLQIWKPEMSAQQLAKMAVETGLLGRATAKRVQDLVTHAFAPRYLVNNARPAKQLKILLDTGISISHLGQLFFVHTARANAVLRDFISEVYWAKYSAGASHITTQDGLSFLETAYNLGRLSKKWSDKMMSRVASGLGACLADFDFLEKGRKQKREILTPRIKELTTLYIAHDAHFSGYGDNGILEHFDWRLFGLEEFEVVRELQRVSNGHFIPQFSGELLRISWKYESMEEALHGFASAEF